MKDGGAGPADHPHVVPDSVDGVEVPGGPDFERKLEVKDAPADAAGVTGENEAALSDGQGPVAVKVQSKQAASGQSVDVGGSEEAVAHGGKSSPASDESSGLVVWKAAGEPTGTAWTGEGLPGFSTVASLEEAPWLGIGGIGKEEADFVIDKADVVESRKSQPLATMPLEAAIASVEKDAFTASVGEFLAAGHPANIGIEEMERAERSTHAGELAFPGLTTVDGVPDNSFVADSPALVLVDELDRAKAGIVGVAQLCGGGMCGGAWN
jgi:hypothetical protein